METGSDAAYGTWSPAESPAVVQYSLSVFHEIDFLVNEGYRRIPYGGIEHGGLLFGRASGNEIRLEAFRQIEVEHASGPSFVLSEKDTEGVKEQIRGSADDPQLGQLQPVGLFISHSRRDFKVLEGDWRLVESLLPQKSPLLVLVKPEKFKPTQFAFVLHGEAPVEGFALPSLRPARVEPKAVPDYEPVAQKLPDDRELPGPKAEPPPDKAVVVDLPRAEPTVFSPPPIVESREGFALGVERQRPAVTANARGTGPLAWPFVVAASVILIAGSFLYFDWNFLQRPVELHANRTGGRVMVSWPPAETIRTNEAKLQVWSRSGFKIIDLPAAARETGRVAADAPGDNITLELVAHHWLHDRRGMIRMIGQ